jgi:hypothetical protein
MWCFKHALEKKMEETGIRFAPRWSFDHARPHDSWFGQTTTGLRPSAWCDRLDIPKHGSDIQRVIEHTWGRFKRDLHNQLYTCCSSTGHANPPLVKVRQLAVAALQSAARVESVAKDAAQLKYTLEVIAHEKDEVFYMVKDGREKEFVGSGGDWPAKAFR